MVFTLLPALFLLSVTAAKHDEIFKQAVGPCINDKCQTEYACFYGQCVPETIAPKMAQINPNTAVGPCINNLCPRNTFCHKEQCYPDPK